MRQVIIQNKLDPAYTWIKTIDFNSKQLLLKFCTNLTRKLRNTIFCPLLRTRVILETMKANKKATNLLTKGREEVYKRCARGDKKDSRKAIPLIQKGKFSKFSSRCQPWWQLREILNQTNYQSAQKNPGYGTEPI